MVKIFGYKLRKRLRQIGTYVDMKFLLFVNNQEPITFDSQKDCFEYLRKFRQKTEIFKLQIFRVETYSL